MPMGSLGRVDGCIGLLAVLVLRSREQTIPSKDLSTFPGGRQRLFGDEVILEPLLGSWAL